jgi:hypothetical protein
LNTRRSTRACEPASARHCVCRATSFIFCPISIGIVITLAPTLGHVPWSLALVDFANRRASRFSLGGDPHKAQPQGSPRVTLGASP